MGIKDQKEKVDPLALMAERGGRGRHSRADKEVISDSEKEGSESNEEYKGILKQMALLTKAV